MVTQSTKWLKLDNSAKIYPMLFNKNNQNLFRISVELKQDVILEQLQNALELVAIRFPSMNVSLLKGLFWYYFENNKETPLVTEESDEILSKISFKKCKGYNYQVSYFNRRITVEFYHVICDGTGALEYIKSILYTYLKLTGADVQSEQKILTVNTPITSGEFEDSFITNYQSKKLNELKIDALRGNIAVKINGMQFKNNGKGIVQANMDGSKLNAIAKSYNATITEFLGSLFIFSIIQTKAYTSTTDESVQLRVPINLRNLFPSKTLRNFSLFAMIGVDVNNTLKLEDIIEIFKEEMLRDTNKELLLGKICTTVRAEKLLITRITPLPLKFIAFKIGNLFFGKNKKTATFSNLGRIDLPKSFEPYVDEISCCLNVNVATPLNMTIATTYNNLSISFIRLITDTEIETFFIRHLTNLGLDVSVRSNMWENTNAL